MIPKATLESAFFAEKVGDIEHSPALVLPSTTTVAQAVEAMRAKRCGCIVVVDDGKVRGTFTERNIANCAARWKQDCGRPIADFTTADVPTLSLEDSAATAIDHMHRAGVRHLPILDAQGKVVAVLSVRDIINLVAEYHPTEVYNLPPRRRQKMRTAEGA